ncbi:MAG: glycosyltransferase family 87 protein [Acetobacteraceae bacterium]|nr:glycosyltransferase family 87 protein [Acetobacteraceae bacterium]
MSRPGRLARLIDFLRRADWLNSNRIFAWSAVLLIEEALIVGFLALWQHGVITADASGPSSDFVSFYAAGKLALAGTPALAYDQAAHFLAEQQAATGGGYQYFFYPPIFLMLCAVLARLPYLVAYAAFQVVTLSLFVATMGAVLRVSGWKWIVPLLAFPPVFWTLGLGQNAFLTASLFGGFTLLVDRRPLSAGALLGLLCYKPHFGLLAPVALLAGRRWRAFAAAALMVAGLVGLSAWLFGWDTWAAYLAAFRSSNAVYGSGRIDYAGVVTLFGAARLLGVGTTQAYAVQAVAAVLMAGLIALIWRRDMSLPVRAASLLAGTLLAVPLALLYDKLLVLLAIAWLVREARRTGFQSWEKLVLLLTWPVSLLTWPVGSNWHVPLGPLVSFAVLLMCLRRVWRAQAQTHPTQGRPTADQARAIPCQPRWKGVLRLMPPERHRSA